MKQQLAKAGLWLLALAMGGTAAAAAQITPVPAFSSTKAGSSRRDVTLAFSFPKAPAVESSSLLPSRPSRTLAAPVLAVQSAQEVSSLPTTAKDSSPRSAATSSMGLRS